MKTIPSLVPGSSAWLQSRSASKAPAMMGDDPRTSRSELLRMMATGIGKEFSEWVQKNLLDKGKESEVGGLDIAEDVLNDSLSPICGATDDDYLTAAPDGANFTGNIGVEVKAWNEKTAAFVCDGIVPPYHSWQLDQQILVCGFDYILFCVTDGTREKFVSCEYRSTPERAAKLMAGWKQFDADLATYTPPEVIPAAVAAPQMQLPAVSVQVNGGVAVVDNLTVFGDALRAYVERINKQPATDQDFADLESTVKTLKNAEEALEAVKASALGQVQSIDLMKRTADQLQELARANRLTIEKLVKAEKENRRNAIIRDGQMSVGAHIANLNARIGKPYMPIIVADFAGEVKGLKTISSIQNAVDTELARVKIEANEIADRIEINLNYLRENAKDYAFLFADTSTIVLKQKDDFEALAKLRITEHKEAEDKRIESETQRIRAEEEAKAAAKVKAEQEDAARLDALAEARATLESTTMCWKCNYTYQRDETSCPRCGATNGNVDPATANVEVTRSHGTKTVIAIDGPFTSDVQIPQADTGATIKLGEISSKLRFTVTAEFLGLLGFHAEQRQNARLYRECDFPRICAAIARHCDSVGSTSMQRAA